MATIINININSDHFPMPDNGSFGDRAFDVEPWELMEGYVSTREYQERARKKGKKKSKAKKCSKGQVCGMGCISKLKVCTNDMSTAEFMAHNKAKREAKRAAKAGGAASAAGSANPEIPQQAGGNVTINSLVDIVDLNIENANEKRAGQIAEIYLQGQTQIRPIIVKSAGQGLDERYDVTARQDEARALQIAKEKDKFFELAPSVILTSKNEASVNEQLEITRNLKREIPETSAPKSQPFDHTKQPKNNIALFDIDSVTTIPKVSESEQKTVEALAQNYLKIGNIDPIILRRTGTNQETFDANYDVVSGRLEFAAIRRAKEINPSFELVKGLVVDDSNERNVVDQLQAIYGGG